MPSHLFRRTTPLLVAALLTCVAAGMTRPVRAQSAVSATDLSTLQKALAPLVNAPALETESDLDITAAKAGMSLTVKEHLKVIAKKPGKFRSEVVLLPSGAGAGVASGTGETYLVVSNGPKVLTVQPSVQKYSLVATETFNAANDDMPALGLFVGPLYLGDQALTNMIGLFSKANTPELLAMLKKKGIGLTSKTQTIDGKDFSVFSLAVTRFGTYQFFVDAQTGTLSRMGLNGAQGAMTITMTETISRRNASPAITVATFQVSPPPGTRKVKYVPIGSF